MKTTIVAVLVWITTILWGVAFFLAPSVPGALTLALGTVGAVVITKMLIDEVRESKTC